MILLAFLRGFGEWPDHSSIDCFRNRQGAVLAIKTFPLEREQFRWPEWSNKNQREQCALSGIPHRSLEQRGHFRDFKVWPDNGLQLGNAQQSSRIFADIILFGCLRHYRAQKYSAMPNDRAGLVLCHFSKPSLHCDAVHILNGSASKAVIDELEQFPVYRFGAVAP